MTETKTVLGPRYPLTLTEVSGRGRCLISLGEIPSGVIIEIAPVQVLPIALAQIIETYHLDMMIMWTPGDGVSTLAMPLGVFGLCNHSDEPSAALEIDYVHTLVRLVACCTLRRGDEITIRYRNPGRTYPLDRHEE